MLLRVEFLGLLNERLITIPADQICRCDIHATSIPSQLRCCLTRMRNSSLNVNVAMTGSVRGKTDFGKINEQVKRSLELNPNLAPHIFSKVISYFELPAPSMRWLSLTNTSSSNQMAPLQTRPAQSLIRSVKQLHIKQGAAK